MKAINPGKYNRRITIQQEAPVTSDAWGTATTPWNPVVKTFAKFTPKTYQSTTMDNQPIVRRQAQYELRRIPSVPIQIGMRVVDTTESDATQTWSILDVQDKDGERRELLLICQFVLPDTGA